MTIQVQGELDLASENGLLAAMRAALSGAPAPAEVVLDLSDVVFIDSSGLRSVLSGQDLTRDLGSPFRLRVVDGPVRRLLTLAGVADRFDYA